MATSYFRERARNPYLRTPIDYEEEQSVSPVSPTFSQPMPMAPVVERPPLRAVAPESTTARAPVFSPYDEIEKERTAYEAGVPTTTKGKILQAITGAGLGFLQAAARNPDNPLAAGVGGAATGGAISAISPQAGRAMQFEMVRRPEVEERIRAEEDRIKRTQVAEDRARAIQLDDLKRREAEAGIANTQAQTRARRYENVPYGGGVLDTETGRVTEGQPRATAPLRGRPGDVFLDPQTKQPIAQIPAAPQKPTAMPREAARRTQEIDRLKQQAAESWKAWSEATDPAEKEQLRKDASEAQAQHNAAVRQLGEMFPDYFEVGGFQESNGNQGWAYYKKHQGQAQGASAPGAQSEALPPSGRVFPASELQRFMAKKGFKTEDEAKAYLKSKNYVVR